ncbi:MAG: anthranilate phosphoribosyltransferase [Halieaceae bacterium]|jgi:anthranilate phosphoribosyltransferase|nr:anthranilate phosphoribosyltransferase [Halieaceae bacterium]
MNMQQAIARLAESADINTEEMRAVMRLVMGGDATPAQIGAFLVALRIKGETLDEITAATEVMRELATPVSIKAEHLVDMCGTGGDGANLFNVSTAACFVVAAAGGHVAKHGNRGVSSSSGSSDVLAALGVKLDLSPEQVARCVEELGMGFMFAPAHHTAMRHAAGPRRELGLRTLFNLLGPMTNPAGVKRQLIGVFDPALCRPMVEVLKRLGSEHVMVVHGYEGLDEISSAGPTRVVELREGTISEYDISPTEFGRPLTSIDALQVSDSAGSVALIKAALKGQNPEAANIVILNAGAAIYLSGVAATLADGIQMADDALASGLAWQKVSELAQFTELAQASGA